ncbi:hypothetical protein MF265_21690 [Serratia marcescens]|uniref:hypothetical protein n=1 Tax=Serratia marcescens TaxID=615 RepID=UPI001EEFB017|nr:hypothetical protein [Serratia marcescens]ULH10507.1 hypothetical protein MF265_21690 [Serratia marcescens]
MSKLIMSVFLGMLLGGCGMAAQASNDTSAAITPVVTLGPGPVTSPENSQYMEEKKALETKQAKQHQTKQAKHHSKKTKYHAKKYHKKKP